jgi:hypothetical protein
MASYLVKRQVTITNSDSEGITYYAGDVMSDWELPDLVKEKVKEGVPWYTQNYEALTDTEATLYRKKATATEGKRKLNGLTVDPPWDDYIGLHPKDVIDRMKDLSFEDVEKVRNYERAGQNRPVIVEYVAPSEREPWHDYDNWGVRETLEKMDILDPQTVQDVIVYEMNHKKRPAILEYEPEPEEEEVFIKSSPSAGTVTGADGEEMSDEDSEKLAGIGAASTDAGGQP